MSTIWFLCVKCVYPIRRVGRLWLCRRAVNCCGIIVFAYEFQNYYTSKWARRKPKQINTTFGHSLVQRAMKLWLAMDSRKYGVDAIYDQKRSWNYEIYDIFYCLFIACRPNCGADPTKTPPNLNGNRRRENALTISQSVQSKQSEPLSSINKTLQCFYSSIHKIDSSVKSNTSHNV